MKKDYHMHPAIHLGEERFHAFAQNAIAAGLQRICITEHMPLSVSNARDRIPAGQVGHYCSNLRRLAEGYADRLEILVGIEIDYHPDYTQEIEAVLKEGDFDLVLGSTHMTAGQSPLFPDPKTRLAYAQAAMENSILAARSGYFDVLTHMDKHKGDFLKESCLANLPDPYDFRCIMPQVEQLMKALADENVRLEVNPALAFAFEDIDLTYPQQEFLQCALDKGVRFTYGSDAHKPEQVGRLLDQLRQHPLYGKAIAQWEEEP